jgi:glycosyltransferase involved in cell wall biosynthesis
VRVFHIIHDLLPVLRPDCFPADKKEDHARWLNTVAQLDGVIAISRAVADELQAWLAAHGPERLRPLGIAWWHLGADIELPTAKRGLPRDASKVLDRLRSAPAFLMVGTIEPRKGYAQALSAFELLWSAGVDVRLVLVGKQGWMVDDFVKRMVRHPELGRRLFWLEGISDEYLEQIYAASSCLLAPSEGEGFGLPLIEAARHKLAILARDIPVFREVAGEHAAYFSGNNPEDLAIAVGDWLALFKSGRHPRSDAMPWSTWQQSTQQLLDVIMQEQWAITWPAALKA